MTLPPPPPLRPLDRYKYMHGGDGDFHNPFDKGWRANCGETCHPHQAAPSPFLLRWAWRLERAAGLGPHVVAGWLPQQLVPDSGACNGG